MKSKIGVILLVYVDDFIIGATKPAGIQEVRKAFEQHVKVKSTGTMTNSTGNGGALHERVPKSKHLRMRVPPEYLRPVFHEYGDLRPTATPPSDLEKSKTPPQVLSSEAAAKYRRILAKLGPIEARPRQDSLDIGPRTKGSKQPF